MKYVRFQREGRSGFGVLEQENQIRVATGEMFDRPQLIESTLPLERVRLLPPCNPGAMIALWNNSKVQIAKFRRETPEEVLYFLKPSSCFIAHGDSILYPKTETKRVVLEGEIGIVIGRICKMVTAQQAKDFIFGYTVVNDVTAQDVVKRDPTFPQYSRAKGYDTFGSFGPCIDTEVDPLTLRIESFINGKRCQDYPVTDLVFNPYEIVADISRTMTLRPGDVITCGTSLGADPIVPGDAVEIRIDGIGSLINHVVE